MTQHRWLTNPAKFGACRTLTGHHWNRTDAPLRLYGARTLEIELRCSRCTAQRTDRIAMQTHTLAARQYRHPRGYKIETQPGQRRPTKATLRGEYLQHLLKHSPVEKVKS